MKFTIDPPSIETIFQRMIDGMGYHDAQSIPAKDVFLMFAEWFRWEHARNDQLSKLLEEMNAISLRPLILNCKPPGDTPEG